MGHGRGAGSGHRVPGSRYGRGVAEGPHAGTRDGTCRPCARSPCRGGAPPLEPDYSRNGARATAERVQAPGRVTDARGRNRPHRDAVGVPATKAQNEVPGTATNGHHRPCRSSDPRADPHQTETRRRGVQSAACVRKACDAAHIPRWHPNQLRHTFGTEIRARFGLEAAQVLLGHTKANVTQVYAERDLSLAVRVAEQMG
ncbi:tyrosine-type recombinase/integrase [Gemmata massiliana]|uniref:tyrosine-type recombinase/integrase n=1 Tax=Gemmata massiliana TaxID=1210884 RepID=UPI0036F308DA